LHFDFGNVALRANLEQADRYLRNRLRKMAQQNGIPLDNRDTPEEQFRQLLEECHEKHDKKIVVLIDEYDKPLIERLHKPEEARAFHQYLSSFYGIIKPQAESIEFLFITGITRFEKLNIFSGLNQLQEITLDRDFHAIAGFTEAEIREYYADHILQLGIRDLENGVREGSMAKNRIDLAIERKGSIWILELKSIVTKGGPSGHERSRRKASGYSPCTDPRSGLPPAVSTARQESDLSRYRHCSSAGLSGK